MNTENAAKADVTSSTPANLMSSSDWNPSAATTCNMCAVSNGAWDDDTKICSARSSSSQSIEDFLSASLLCKDEADVCVKQGDSSVEYYEVKNKKKVEVKKSHTYAKDYNYSWSYRFKYLEDGKPPKYEQWDMCKGSFTLPVKYSGGLGVLLKED